MDGQSVFEDDTGGQNTKKRLQSRSSTDVFWWENLGIKKERMRGGLHTTHGIAFQVETPCNMARSNDVHSKSGERSITNEQHPLLSMKFVLHKSAELFQEDSISNDNGQDIEKLMLIWRLMRQNYTDLQQCIPRFVGWEVLV